MRVDDKALVENQLSEQIIGAAIEVHKHMGPGLLESVYEECLAYELNLRKIAFERQKPVPLHYKGLEVSEMLRLDLLIGGLVVVEIKSVQFLLPIHEAQLMTYLKLTGCKLGLLLNFNTALLKDGIVRMANHL